MRHQAHQYGYARELVIKEIGLSGATNIGAIESPRLL